MKLLNGVKKRRQHSALERLEKQLTVGTKTVNEFDGFKSAYKMTIPLSEKDIKRIKSEIQTLKSRI